MSKLCIFVCFILVVQASQADDDENDEQLAADREQESSEYYLASAYGFTSNPWGPYYYLSSRVPGTKTICYRSIG